MCSLGIVGVHPRIKVCLQLFDRGIDLNLECNSIELILHGSVKSFTYTVCQRAFRLNLGMINVFHSQIQFILMIFSISAVFRSSICYHTHQFQVMLIEKRNNPIVKHIGSDKRILSVIQLGKDTSSVTATPLMTLLRTERTCAYADVSHISDAT